MDITLLKEQHDALLVIVDQLSALVKQDKPQAVSALRWRLARVLTAHLAIEDNCLYPALIGSGLPVAAELATRMQAEVGGLARAFNAYLADWPEQRIPQEWTRFRQETLGILTVLRERISRENHQLYPLVRGIRDAGAGLARPLTPLPSPIRPGAAH